MKMKKLVSIGTLALVMVSSVSVGASAAERPTNAQIKKDMAAMFINDKNPLNYNLNAGTVASNVLDKDKLAADANTYGFSYLSDAINVIDPSQTMQKNAQIIFRNFNVTTLLTQVRDVAVQLRNIDNSNGSDKFNMENDMKKLFQSKDPNVDVKFGRNIDGYITMSITKSGRVILQLTSQNEYTISDALGNSTDKLTQYATLLSLL